MRPAPAPRLSGKHNRPPQAGTFVGSHFFTDRSRFAPAQRSLVPPSMAEHPKMFTSSAVVMPPQGQNLNKKPKSQNQKPKTKNQKPKAKSQKPKAKSQKPKAKSQKPKAKSQKPKAKIY